MRFVIMSLVGIAVLASPCAYDTDPRESAAVVGILTHPVSAEAAVEFAAPETGASNAPFEKAS